MNKDMLQGKWKVLKGDAKKAWGKLTDDDWMQVEGHAEKLAGLLQQRYGFSKEQSEKEIDNFMKKH